MEAPLKEVELVCSFGFARIVLHCVSGERDSERRILRSACHHLVVDVQGHGSTHKTSTCAFGS